MPRLSADPAISIRIHAHVDFLSIAGSGLVQDPIPAAQPSDMGLRASSVGQAAYHQSASAQGMKARGRWH
jgi:hypothetical protein